MKDVPVVIVGAGPAGLVLALSLARYEVHSTILERDLEIGEDPRGVYLAGDAVRILYHLGFGDQMGHIGHEMESVYFHKSDFRNEPFFTLPMSMDWLEQAVSTGVYQIQPRLEACLRDAVNKSLYCKLQRGCRVVSRDELADSVVVTYEESNTEKKIKTSWLIGADGKTGVVRKKFLEPTADIRQEVGLFSYTGTWVAANLKITLPTPETHPELCFWEMDMTSEDVYDLFWPTNWHFCSPPGKPTACGRFGPVKSRYWRHEFAEPNWNDSKDATELMWEHLTPMITRNSDVNGRPFPAGDVTFPRECIGIQRCRPFTFCQKVVNKWFHDRTILIGDAAHVFPPFGGQGIACGIRDGDSLAWRLAILLRLPKVTKSLRDDILQAWAAERRQGVDDSTRLTMVNGKLTNDPETWSFFIFRKMGAWLSAIPGFPTTYTITQAGERAGYKLTKLGCFLPGHGGGGKIAQVYVKSNNGRSRLSDELLRHGQAAMTVLIIGGNPKDETERVKAVLSRRKISPSILSEQSVVVLSSESWGDVSMKGEESYRLCPKVELSAIKLIKGYDDQNYLKRFPRGTKYAILRPDLIIFSASKSVPELEACLKELKAKLEG